ncbi:LysE family translocator [Chitinimonas sp.]|uniref:LysE family translocator n=1 Tax=Chitinimonas sp. TaxID=1934313 RepID=UPI0035B01202
MPLSAYLLFCTVALASTMTPGPAVMLAIRNGANHGWRTAIASSLGNISGLLCLTCVSMAGMGALMKSSAVVFGMVKLLGAGYLMFLGIKQWRNADKPMASACAQEETTGTRALYLEGLLLALTNPKAILFIAALLPQFIDNDAPLLKQVAILTATFLTFSFCSLMSYATLASVAQARFLGLLRSPLFNRTIGACFIAFGALLLRLRRA